MWHSGALNVSIFRKRTDLLPFVSVTAGTRR